MRLTNASLVVALVAAATSAANAFQVSFTQTTPRSAVVQQQKQQQFTFLARSARRSFKLKAANDDEDGEEEKVVNPYADPNYPDVSYPYLVHTFSFFFHKTSHKKIIINIY